MAVNNRISSFAVLDLETTGLPDHNFNKANITELSIHGISYDTADPKNTRVIHKLNLLFNPRMRIDPYAEKITQLSNEILESESSFDVNAANLIISFLKHLKQPVCLVAHNGYKFDFPILKHAFAKINMELPCDILCIDSLPAIKEIDKLDLEKEEMEKLALEKEETEKMALEEEEILPSQESELKPVAEVGNLSSVSEKEPEDNDEKASINFQKLNEKTPKRPIVYQTRSKSIQKPQACTRKMKLKPRSLFESIPTSEVVEQRNVVKDTKKKCSYKLGEIYTRLFNETPDVSHQAEADVIMLVNILREYGESFVRYTEENAKPFFEVNRLGACPCKSST